MVFQSGFSRSGWGIRRLIPSELSQAFDLPSYVEWDESFPTHLVPIQLFRVVGDAVSGCLRERSATEEQPKQRLRIANSSVGPVERRDAPIWLPIIGKWLPGAWADAEIAAKAVKADNASVDFRPWNLRVSLVFPWIHTAALRGFEQLALRRWRSSLSRSFFRYLRETYGSYWLRRWAATQTSGSRKRARPGGEVMQDHEEGGTILDRLARDVKCGRQVLNQAMRSEWWDWKGGSSLFFWR